MTMQAKVVLPSGVLLQEDIAKLVAEGQNGSFCLLPRHVDFASALVPGILALTRPDGEELFLAVDDGILVKRGREVLVATGNAVEGRLGELRQAVRERSRRIGEREQQARVALDHLEASLVRRVFEWEGRGHG